MYATNQPKNILLKWEKDNWAIGRKKAIWGLPSLNLKWEEIRASLQEHDFQAGCEIIAISGPMAHFRAITGSDKGEDTLFIKVNYAQARKWVILQNNKISKKIMLNTIGLILDFFGVIILLYVSCKTKGTTTPADENYIISRWYHRIGYSLLALGFLLQILSTNIE